MSVQSTTRGQSETVGAILLVAVVTLSVATFGTFYLGDIGEGSEAPSVDASAEVTTDEVVIYHEAGEAVEESALRVTLRVDGTEWTNVTWASGTVTGTDDGRFAEGESWTWDDGTFAEGDRVEVFLADSSTETLLFRGTYTVVA